VLLTDLDQGWEELLDPLLDMRFDPASAQRFLEIIGQIHPRGDGIDRELIRRLWTIPLLLDRIGSSLVLEREDIYKEQFIPWEQSVFIELARILGEPYDLSKR